MNENKRMQIHHTVHTNKKDKQLLFAETVVSNTFAQIHL